MSGVQYRLSLSREGQASDSCLLLDKRSQDLGSKGANLSRMAIEQDSNLRVDTLQSPQSFFTCCQAHVSPRALSTDMSNCDALGLSETL